MSIWDDIAAVVDQGKDPVLNLNYGMLKIPEPKKRGRKRKPPRVPSDAERLARPLLGSRTRPRCLNPHCRVRLRAGQLHVCGEPCRVSALIHYQAVVDVLLRRKPEEPDDVPEPQADPRWIHAERTPKKPRRAARRRGAGGR